MQMFGQKKGLLQGGIINKAIYGIIGMVVLFALYATLVPTAQTYGNNLSNSGLPFGSLFASNGIVFILIMVALLLTVVGYFMGKGNK